MQADVRDVLADLARVLRRLRVRWYVFGAQAVIATGLARYTADLDVTVEPPHSGPKALVSALQRGGFEVRDVTDVKTFIAVTRVVPMRHVTSQMPVDIVLASRLPLEEAMFERAERKKLGGTSIPFVHVADLIALKLLAARPKDIEDVKSLIRARVVGLDVVEARRRVAELGAALDDSTMLAAFDRIVGKTKTKKKR